MASPARKRIAWVVITLLILVAVWLFATGRRTTEDLVRVLDWKVPLLVGYWLGARSERRLQRRRQKELRLQHAADRQ